MPDNFVDAYDKATGRKLVHQVPEHLIDLFPNLAKTPQAAARAQQEPAPESAPEAGSSVSTATAKGQANTKKEG